MKISHNHFFLSSSQDVNEICKPLFTLGITYFTYTRSYDDGNRLYLGSNRETLANYLHKKFYLVGNVESKPSNYKPQIVLWSTLPKQYIYDENIRSRGIDHGIFMIQPGKGYCDFYAYATKKENERIVNFYLTKTDLLHQFNLYFKEQAAALIQQAEKNKIILPFHNDALDFIDDYANHRLNKILHSINQSPPLTNRQLECAYLLLQGKTSKEIGIEINLSTRTVEHYLNLIKAKLNCRNKPELIIALTKIIKQVNK